MVLLIPYAGRWAAGCSPAQLLVPCMLPCPQQPLLHNIGWAGVLNVPDCRGKNLRVWRRQPRLTCTAARQASSESASRHRFTRIVAET